MLRDEILKYLYALHDKLQEQDVKGELCLYGGAVMCLAYEARPSTKDVDAVFQPAQIIRSAAKEIAHEHNLSEDWLNDGVKGFLVEHTRKVFLNLSHLTVMIADPEYLLAMKALSARIDATDGQDISFLVRKLSITKVSQVLDLIEAYYPRRVIRPATQFFLEEILNENPGDSGH